MAAEEKARSTYEYLMNLTDDPDVLEPLRFLREREIVHFQRFGEALRYVQEYMDSKRMFIIDKPNFMKPDCGCKKPDCDYQKPDCDCKNPNCNKPNGGCIQPRFRNRGMM